MTDLQATAPHVAGDGASQLARLLDGYLADLQAGRAPDKQRLLAEHPALADVLGSCLAALDFIHRSGRADAEAPPQLGDFRVLREVGRGGMGVVYEAEQLSLRRRVALKVLRFGGPADPEALARFRREAETVARLHHTNIVPVFAFGCEQGVHYYAMQLIAGRSLADVPRGPLPAPAVVAGWGLQAAEALAYAHQRGVVHRDVKPSNLLLDGEGVVWLSDFGLARRAEETALTAAGVPLGTPRYMSPEQVAAAQPVDHRTDVYSLGATLYELVTGRPVFDADNVPQLLAQVREAEPVPPRRLRPEVPRDLETILLKCLAKEPERRYASAQDLADDLRAFREDRPIRARRPSLLERSRRWLGSRRFTAQALVKGAVLAGLAAGLLVAWGLALRGALRTFEAAQLTVRMAPGAAEVELPLTGELLHAQRDEPLAPPFGVPTTSPVAVPAGMHRLRLSRPGWLSATYWVNVKPGVNAWSVAPFEGPAPPGPPPVVGGGEDWQAMARYHRLDLAKHHLWARPLVGASPCGLVPGARGHDVIVLGQTDQPAPGVIPVMALQRREGATGRALWAQKLLPDNPVGKAWQRFFPGNESLSLVPVGGDLVCASRSTATLLALSGKTGDLLWLHTSAELGARGPTGALDTVTGKPAVVLRQPTGRVNGVVPCVAGGRGLLVAAMAVNDEGRTALHALTAEKGQPVWSAVLSEGRPAGWGEKGARPHEVWPVPELITLWGEPVVACACGGKLFGLRARDGKPAWPARALGFRLVHPPRFADLDGDGNADALLLHEDRENELTLTALDLARGRVMWEATWEGPPEPARVEDLNLAEQDGPPDWPLAVDLDGDGRPEVVVRRVAVRPGDVPQRVRSSKDGDVVERVEVVVLEGATGATRWARQLGRSHSLRMRCRNTLRLLPGPDLDGDGRRELFVASLLVPWRPGFWQPLDLYVDALSGADGRSVWWWRQPLTGPTSGGLWGAGLGPLGWWPADKEGAPLLLVPLEGESRGPTQPAVRTYALASDSGRLRHLVPSLQRPTVADLDGDGRPELLGWTVGGDADPSPRRWRPIRGTAPATVEAAQRWRPAKTVLLGPEGSKDEWDAEPPAEGGPPAEDPRRRVPLPWERHFLLVLPFT
jgi:hypothetical protein